MFLCRLTYDSDDEVVVAVVALVAGVGVVADVACAGAAFRMKPYSANSKCFRLEVQNSTPHLQDSCA